MCMKTNHVHSGNMVEITVYGVAQPAGSKRAFVSPKTGKALVTDANKKSKPWQAEVKSAALEALMPDLLPFPEGPVSLSLIFFMPKPKSVNRDWPTVRPDLLKLTRGVEDALTGIVWKDDSQIVFEVLTKRYADVPRVEIAVQATTGTELDS